MTVTRLQPEGDRFEEFWRLYPRKVGKLVARKKWEAIIAGTTTRTKERDSEQYVSLDLNATPDEILHGLKAWIRANTNFRGEFLIEDRYVPHPATWLNRGLWLDHE